MRKGHGFGEHFCVMVFSFTFVLVQTSVLETQVLSDSQIFLIGPTTQEYTIIVLFIFAFQGVSFIILTSNKVYFQNKALILRARSKEPIYIYYFIKKIEGFLSGLIFIVVTILITSQ